MSFCVKSCHFVLIRVILSQLVSFWVNSFHFVSIHFVLCQFVSILAILRKIVSFCIGSCRLVSILVIFCQFMSLIVISGGALKLFRFEPNLHIFFLSLSKTQVLLKSVHLKKIVVRISFLSKLWYFLFWFVLKVPQFWKKPDLCNCLLKMNGL